MDASKLIKSVLSPLVDGRIYPLVVSETEAAIIKGKSYIVYTPITSIDTTTTDGHTGHERVPFQIDVYDYSYGLANDLMKSVINTISDQIDGASFNGRSPFPEPKPGLYRQTADVRIWGTIFLINQRTAVMAKDNIVDSFYRLNMDLVGDATTFTKIPLLQECAPPKSEKVSDNITATDDQEEIMVVVDFKKNSQIDFEIVYDSTDPTHIKLDQMWDDNSYAAFEYEFVKLLRKKTFTAQLMKWEESTDKEKKLRMKGTLTVSELVTTNNV